MKNLFKAILAVAAVICAGSVYAVGTLTIFDGTTTITVTDGSALDSNPAPGAVTWIGTIGVWNINVDTGLTKPAVGSAVLPVMDLSFLGHSAKSRKARRGPSSTGAGTLTLTWSDSGFTATGLGTGEIGGTAGGTVTDQILKNGVVVLSQGPLGPGAFSGTTSGFIALKPSDVLSLQVIIHHSAPATTTGNQAFTVVPDGGSAVALLGIALVGVEALRRKLKAC